MKTKIRDNRVLIVLVLMVLSFLPCSCMVAYADMGPKDSLTVYVANPPDEEFYLDLLAQNLPKESYSWLDDDNQELDQQMIQLLFCLESEGWLPALAHGTSMPMWGKLQGEKSGSKTKHVFGYYGLPDTYRIIIVTKSGEVSISQVQTRKALQSSVTFDYLTKKVEVPLLFWAYLLQFATTFSLTLLVEGIILILFRYELKKNWWIFLLVNFATQIFMTLTVGIALIKSGALIANLLLFPVEIGILISESIAYCFLLKGKTRRRNIGYGIVANLASWLIGFFFFNATFQLIIDLL